MYKPSKPTKKRCPNCNNKLTVMNFRCNKCNKIHCLQCNAPEIHHCDKLIIKDKLELPDAVIPSKLDKV
jgi:hypothetical protein